MVVVENRIEDRVETSDGLSAIDRIVREEQNIARPGKEKKMPAIVRSAYYVGMKNLNRRDLCIGLSAFAALSSVMAEAQAGAAAGPDGKLSKSVVFNYDQLPVKNNANGGTGRQVLSGTLATGEQSGVHQRRQAGTGWSGRGRLHGVQRDARPEERRHDDSELLRSCSGSAKEGELGGPLRLTPAGSMLASYW